MSFFQKFSSLFSDDHLQADDSFLALDIGTAAVKAAIFQIEKGEGNNLVANIVGAGKAALANDITNEENYSDAVKACLDAKKEAENMSGVKSHQAIISLAGQSVKFTTNIIEFVRSEKRPIDLAEVKNYIQKAQQKIFEQIRKKEALETGFSEFDIKLADGRIPHIKIDGYNVIDPIGFSGRELSFTILNNYTTADCLKILQSIRKALDIKIFSLVSGPYATANALLANVFKTGNINEASCILIDCAGKVTDISIFHKGFSEGPKTINLGGNSFTKRLASKFQLSNGEAEEFKMKYSRGELSPQVKRKVTECLNMDLRIWLKGIETILVSDYSGLEGLPALVLMYGGSCVLPGIKKALESEEWKKDINFLGPMGFEIINGNDIEGIKDRTNLLDNSGDITLLSLVNFGLLLAKKESAMNSVLNRVIRLIQG